MKRYVGMRKRDGVQVAVDGRPLDFRLDLWSHSPTGFEWGHRGSGSAQLALALLADCLDDEGDAIGWHQDYMENVVAGLPHEGWTLTEGEIRETIGAFENA